MNNSDIAITRQRVIHQVWIQLLRLPSIVLVQEFLGIEIRDTYHLAIRTHNSILHGIFLLRSKTREFNPEISTIGSLLELIVVGDGPVVEIAYYKDMLSRFGLATSVGTKSDLSIIVLVVIDAIDDTRRAIGKRRIVRNTSASCSSSCFVSRSHGEFEVVVALLVQCLGVRHLGTRSGFNYLAVEF